MWYVQQNIDGHNKFDGKYVGMYSDPYGYKSVAQVCREIDYDESYVKKFQKQSDKDRKDVR